MKKTKIVATIGPASEDEKILREMIKSGMNVARLNFSHGSHEWHAKIIKTIRGLALEMRTSVGILADLQGPRIRIQTAENISAREGEEILISDVLYKKSVADFSSKIFYLDYPGIIDDIRKGDEILIEDGLIKVRVLRKEKYLLRARVINGGVIKNRKGVNIPGAKLNLSAITPKDKKDLEFALKYNVDFVALSFVSSAKDILSLRRKIERKLGKKKRRPQIIAKIEKREALKNLEEIIRAADAVMVARGDLGIEMNENKVAVLQKKIIAASLENLKPVIVATQMLDSMIKNPRPTRAEVSDVSNAVIDHADAVMLSGETANGKYPAESVRTMSGIIEDTEESPFDDIYKSLDFNISSEYAVIIRSAYELARSFGADAILMISVSGFTARLVSHFRPEQKILMATNNQKTFNQSSLVWGVDSYLFKPSDNLDGLIDKMIKKAKADKKLKKGDNAVIILGKLPGGEKMRLVGVKEM